MRVVCFSLWGSRPFYCQGAIRNAELMPSIYPGWKMIVYHDTSVPADILVKLKSLGVEFRKPCCSNGYFWRFEIADDKKVEAFIIRDTDSRINQREAKAVSEWLASGKNAHVIADHPSHTPVIGGGLWGMHNLSWSMQKLITDCPASSLENDRKVTYNSDQIFLRDVIWPKIQHDVLVHDLCWHPMRTQAVPFPSKFGDNRFVGEVFSADDEPRAFDSEMRINFQEP